MRSRSRSAVYAAKLAGEPEYGCVDAPLFRVEAEERERARLAQPLERVGVLVAAVVRAPGSPSSTCS